MKTIFQKFRSGLSKTRSHLKSALESAVKRKSSFDDEMYEEIEAALIQTDMGLEMAEEIMEALKSKIKNPISSEEIYSFLASEVQKRLSKSDWVNDIDVSLSAKPYVIMVVGVNGSGKTTTIGKLAHIHRGLGRKVLVAAGDTYRAAAVEQLEVWSKRADAEIVKSAPGADPASVAHDAMKAAISRDIDVLIIDTAGRLHTSINLMEELKKIKRVIASICESAPHEVLLSLDANNGRNALIQAKEFQEAVGVNGIVLNKLDGTAKGGIALSINHELNIPVKYIGVGEDLEDLEPFEAEAFASSLFFGEGSE
ncbi:MAG: signal recognition particle-docking protein FtsY [Candidatus Marinimicrobia bacterium]|nr:signal recognition particle-docking protein FtsY [Candidatus Neomarinimicrobiota bacterium]